MDKRASLIPKSFAIIDGSLVYKIARCKAICAISGGSKSPILGEATAEISCDAFRQHCLRSDNPGIRKLADDKWRYEKGGSAAAFLRSAAENQGAFGVRGIVEEAGNMFNKYPNEKDGSKMQVPEYIKLFNAVLDVGKLTICRGDEEAKGFWFVLTMGVQRTQLHFFLPYTSQGGIIPPGRDVIADHPGPETETHRQNNR